ncbi:MAG TPA: chorismate mutase [Solirubrobacteraceae bacterium]|nr:chorismate mutase [Solirubrobacteraceae bacterium]
MSARGPDTASASGLEPFRRRLDQLDGEIAGRLGERFAICREIALYKREHDIPMMQPDRVAEVRSRYLSRGAEVQLPADFTADLFELLIGATCRMEDELIAGQAPGARDGGLPGDGGLLEDGLGEVTRVARDGEGS